MNIIKNTNILQKSKNIIQDNFFMSQKRKNIFIQTFIYSWTITEDNTTIYFFLQDNSISKYKPCIRKILTWIQYMRYYFHNTKPLTLWIYPSEYTKKIPGIGQDHFIDSGQYENDKPAKKISTFSHYTSKVLKIIKF